MQEEKKLFTRKATGLVREIVKFRNKLERNPTALVVGGVTYFIYMI
ncbi:unnamed protein product [marine sediment metagenome]|uniref:Uncharacterized protein n=1 Tax=marine sediment metagenome TaxID=412755 RepID=X1B873_9ZZZZ